MPATLYINENNKVNVGSFMVQSEKEVRRTFTELLYNHYQEPKMNSFHPVPMLNTRNKQLLEVLIVAWKNNLPITVTELGTELQTV